MIKKVRMVVSIVVMFLAVIVVNAQTSEEFKQRYGKPKTEQHTYEIRPDILMHVSFESNNQVKQITIESAKNDPNSSATNGELFSHETITEIVDEIAPVSQRGKLLGHFIFTSGVTGLDTYKYEHVIIVLVQTQRGEVAGIESAKIVWE